MDDHALRALLDRDPAAGTQAVLDRYGPLLGYVVRGILRDPQDAEDCLSDISLALWRNLAQYDPERGSMKAWLTALARNTALNHRTARQRQEAHRAETGQEPAHWDTPEREVLRKERAEQLRAALDRLSDRDRQLFYRKYYYLQSTAQIAAELGLSERAAEGRLYRLRQRLRRELGGDGDD